MLSLETEAVGMGAAILTTICWIPQAWRILVTRDTRAISLVTQSLFACGIALWLAYGILLGSVPIIASNVVTLVLVVMILAMKIYFG